MDDVPAAIPPVRDWSELPLDVLSTIFVKVGAIHVLMGAGLVCHSWLEAAKVPDVLRSVKMEEVDHKFVGRIKYRARVLAMAKVAVDRSSGRLVMFAGEWFVNNKLLMYIAERSPSLKSLRLSKCEYIEDDVFIEVVRNSQLAELQCLELIEIGLTHDELTAILENCPRLETLDMFNCYNIILDEDEALRAKCDTIKKLTISDWFSDTDYNYTYYSFQDTDNDYDSDDSYN